MKYLVTGGGGFVGSYLVESLLKKGHEVRVLDKAIGELESIKNSPKLEIVIGGIEDPETVNSAMNGVDVVYHLAWSFAPRPADAFKIDVGGYINVLEAAVANKVKHFLFPSSSVVYGEPEYTPVDENHPHYPLKSRDPLHALTKSIVQSLSSFYYSQYKLPCTVFVFWWGYGSGHIPGRNLRNIIDSALKGETIKAPEKANGSPLYLGDIGKAYELATLNGKAYGQEFNLASFHMKWRETIELIVKLANSSSKIEIVPDEKWDGPGFLTGNWDMSTEKAGKLLGYKPGAEEAKRIFAEALKKDIEVRRGMMKLA